MPLSHKGSFSRNSKIVSQFSTTTAFQRLTTVLHLTTSSVNNKGPIKLQVVLRSVSSIADKDRGGTWRSNGAEGPPSIASEKSQLLL